MHKPSFSSISAMVLLGTVVAAFPPNVRAATSFGVVATYDATGGAANTVDTNASGNALSSALLNDVGGFTTAVASAHASNTGGVIDLGNGVSNAATVSLDNNQMGITYGGSKTFNITTTVTLFTGVTGATTTDLRHNLGTITPTSGFSALLPNRNAGVTNWAFGIGGIAGGAANEAITTMGFTLLSRDSTTQNVIVSWFIDGSPTAVFSDTEAIATGRTNDDTFFSYTAPAGSAITGFSVAFGAVTSGTADGRLGIDDIGFITGVVPEPSSVLLFGLAAMTGFLRRRR